MIVLCCAVRCRLEVPTIRAWRDRAREIGGYSRGGADKEACAVYKIIDAALANKFIVAEVFTSSMAICANFVQNSVILMEIYDLNG